MVDARRWLLGTAVLLTAAASGCGGIANYQTLQAAFDRGDLAYLEGACSGSIITVRGEDQRSACWKRDHLVRRNSTMGASCDQIVAAHQKTGAEDFKVAQAVSAKLAECGHWAYLFEHMMHWGNESEGVKILTDLDAAGKPVEAELAKYLAAHKGSRFFPVQGDRANDVRYGIAHLHDWLQKKGHVQQHCGAIGAAALGANTTARVAALGYLKEGNCKEGVPVALETLLDEDGEARVAACKVLGALGDASVLPKVKLVAETDGWAVVREEPREGRIWASRVHPAREACLDASGKIQLRK